ncbi:ABC transporter ATP-binding protein [Chloroflexus sp.]|uniref:ABC transporter ATP-binding protein n=1 Tax=Chloroflexus sp. TaxID=1904827 RepID=UPI002606284F|nr:ABC transporter ATP-binding protein [uncultured Chloroflexus sp.]
MGSPVIDLRDLTVYYGRQRGVEGLDLTVDQGEVFGFLGPNGAGKTTTLRVMMDIIRPTRGQALIFGRNCQREGHFIRQQVGYLPGELRLPDNLTARQYLAMLNGARGRVVEASYLQQLCWQLELDLDRPMRAYSRGNKQKVGLIAALMFRPQLLILDEPTGGLDPLAQQVVIELVRAAREEGRTVFFSSHILPEVQAVCDRVGIIRAGQLVTVERIDALLRRQYVHRIRFRFAEPVPATAFSLPGITLLAVNEHEVTLEVREGLAQVLAQAGAFQAIEVETLPLTLEEVFLAYYGAQGGNHGQPVLA